MRSMAIVGLMFFLISCGMPDNVTVVEPGPDAQKRAQIALIKAKPGDVIEFAEGRFDFTRTLSLDVENVTIRGRGVDKTIWNFENQETGSGGEGLLVTKGDFTIENLAVEDSRGDAIKVEDVKGVIFRNVRVEWAGEPDSTNGAYGIYPVKCKDKTFDPYCEAIYIHDNEFDGGGTNPVGSIGKIIRQAFGKEGPDIVYDGIVDPKKMVDGKLPPELGIYVQNNGDATFVNLDLGGAQKGPQPNISTDLSAYKGSLPSLKSVSIAGVE